MGNQRRGKSREKNWAIPIDIAGKGKSRVSEKQGPPNIGGKRQTYLFGVPAAGEGGDGQWGGSRKNRAKKQWEWSL